MKSFRILAAALAAAGLLSDCGGGGGGYGGSSGGGGGGPTYTIGGMVTGLGSGTLVLQDNGGDNLSITADGGFTFATALPYLNSYDITVLTKPVSRSCTVTNESGVVPLGDVTNVAVTCVPAAVVQLSEVAPNTTGGSKDLVELAAHSSGTT